MDIKKIEISWISLWRIVAVFVLVAALFLIRDVVIVAFIAIIISSALHRPVKYLESKRIPRILAVLMIFLVLAAVVGLILYIVVPIVLIQLKYFFTNINDIKAPLLDTLGVSNFISQADTNLSDWIGGLFYGGSNVLSFFSSFIGNMIYAFVAVVLSFYLSISKGSVERFIRSMMPISQEESAITLYKRMRRKIGRWFNSQIVLSLIVGALTFVGLSIIGTEYALVLAILAALLEIIPYVGPITVGIISFIFIMPQSVSLAIIAVIIFVVIHQIESHVLVPLIVGKAVGIDPVMVVLAILAGSQLDGLVGAIIAVPVAIIVQELIDEWSIKKYAGDEKLAQ